MFLLLILFLLFKLNVSLAMPLSVFSNHIILDTNEQNLQRDLDEYTYTSVLFYNKKCNKCALLSHEYNKLEEHMVINNIMPYRYEMDMTLTDTIKEKYHINALPKLILFKNGNYLERFTGSAIKDLFTFFQIDDNSLHVNRYFNMDKHKDEHEHQVLFFNNKQHPMKIKKKLKGLNVYYAFNNDRNKYTHTKHIDKHNFSLYIVQDKKIIQTKHYEKLNDIIKIISKP